VHAQEKAEDFQSALDSYKKAIESLMSLLQGSSSSSSSFLYLLLLLLLVIVR